MYPHHEEAIRVITQKLSQRPEVLGVIIGGSVAHGFATEASDIDLMIVLSDEDYAEALEKGHIHYFEREATPWEGGYVDGKYTSPGFIRQVALRGSEPARFAFCDAFVSFSRLPELPELVRAAAAYPEENRVVNMEKFHAQLQGWKWYFEEGWRKQNAYLMNTAVSSLVLFSTRLLLAWNRTLYPYHKWMLRVLEGVPEKPDGLMEAIRAVLENQTPENVSRLYDLVHAFAPWSSTAQDWCVRFMLDSELNWLDGPVPVADL